MSPPFCIIPPLHIEKTLLNEGMSLIAGVDEVGRGALAGPLCVGIVIYDASFIASTTGPISGINDSKKLSPRQRMAGARTHPGRAILHPPSWSPTGPLTGST